MQVYKSLSLHIIIKHWSDCADEQAYLRLFCSHAKKARFSHVEVHVHKFSHPNQFKTSFSRITTVSTATGVKEFRFKLIRLALSENIAMIVLFHSKVCVNFLTFCILFSYLRLCFVCFVVFQHFSASLNCVHDGLL